MSDTAQKIEEIYDVEATQRIKVDDEVIAVIKPYSDERYLKFRDELTKKINEYLKNNKKADLTDEVSELEIKESILLNQELADELIDSLENVEDLPADWKSLISYEDKIQLLETAHRFVIDEDNKKFSLKEINVPTACFFNGKAVRQNHKLRPKSIDDSSKYAWITSKELKVTQTGRLEKEKTVEFFSQDEKKAELYDSMLIKAENFKNDKVPLKVKVLVIDYVFASTVNQKK
ncbi:hypothetical protein Bpfe_031035 [Biomphalaria pfeifferi]|uniref:Uncharacterized protein n=1 Tax=Biomphalaria pfeifferi TaxID=112525 RepID=A0AAD8ANM0_BIOPF|nr:hypothetical protein Bpfe_031035 [Biomphalaria pfeifferi]